MTKSVREPGLPPIDHAGDLCGAIGQLLSEASRAMPDPSNAFAAEFDSLRGDDFVLDPLSTANFLISYYLQCCGDFVYSTGKLLQLESPMVMSPAVIARCAAEYSCAVWYLTDPADSSDVRVAKMARLYREAFFTWGVTRPGATDEESALLTRLDVWTKAQNLARAPKLHADQVLESMAPGFGKGEYDWLSSYVHGSAVTVTLAYLSAARHEDARYVESWWNALFVGGVALSAAYRAASLWTVSLDGLAELGTLCEYYRTWLTTGQEPT